MAKKTNDISRLRSEVRQVSKQISELTKPAKTEVQKLANPFTGGVTGNYWTQTGLPWV